MDPNLSQLQVRAALIDAFLAEAMPPEEARTRLKRVAVLEFAAGRALLGLDRQQRAAAAADVLLRLRDAARASSGTYAFINRRTLLQTLAQRLLNASVPLDTEEAIRLAESAAELKGFLFWDIPVGTLLKALEEHVAAHGFSVPLREALSRLQRTPPSSQEQGYCDRLRDLLQGDVRQEPAQVEVRPGDAWADALRSVLAGLPAPSLGAWQDLLFHCRSAKAAAPSDRWLQRAGDLVRAVGPEDFIRSVTLCLSQIGRSGSGPIDGRRSGATDATLLDLEQTDLLRGLVWATTSLGDQRLLPVLGDAAAACFQKIPDHGPRNVKVGNACLQALGRISDLAAVVQLSRLRLKFRSGSICRQIEKAIDEVAQRTGLTAAELEEIAVPRLGMEEVGLRRERIGDFTAEILSQGVNDLELRWLQGDGKLQKAVPATVRSQYPRELAALRKVQKEIQSLLSAQRDRIDQLYCTAAQWDLKTWRERYLDHPLVGVVARRLIWRFSEGSEARLGIAPEGKLVDVRGEPLGDLSPATRVALWHPLDSSPEEVLAWRRWLEERQVRQPFKQAHREIYVLTDAERATEVYSHRFAAHILRQHPFAVLCSQRGWDYQLQGQWDSFNVPCRSLPEHDLRVDFEVEPAQEEETSENAVFLYLGTGPVRFRALSGEPRPLERVPHLLFSELMRDVDLFVSVTSIGNDPNWMDGHRRWGTPYWQQYAFGEINATARTRRETLGRLLPQLKIADRCSLTDRYLIVRGDLRTYKIHLGSGNILMEPNDQFLCIVPKSAASRLFLPFDGDSIFSLILSKAFLLAEDTRISDPAILLQIRR